VVAVLKDYCDYSPDTFVGRSDIHGFGLIASREFQSSELILDYSVYAQNWCKKLYSKLTHNELETHSFVMLDSNNCGLITSELKFWYVNHSREPNGFWDVSANKVYALEHIPRLSEVFIDYRLEPLPHNSGASPWL
jgi:hypothetical protein